MNVENGIYHSYSDTNKMFVTPSGTGKPIKYGDRLFARLVLHGNTIVEFMINRVNDLTELIGELRYSTRGLRGLAQLYIRNFSRGWSMERPLMLYPDLHGSREKSRVSNERMLCPWETH